MPTWVHCRITIRGDRESLETIMMAGFSLEGLGPRPDSVPEEDWQYVYDETRFEGEPQIDDQDYRDQLEVSVSSAWAPPVEFCSYLVRLMPTLFVKIVHEAEDFRSGVTLMRADEQGNVISRRFRWEEPNFDEA